MGRDDVPKDDPVWQFQSPAHTVDVPSFYIDKTEVTNAEYGEFIIATGHSAPKTWSGNKPPTGQEKMPVTFVSLSDAKAYAVWVSARENKPCRVPTEPEWEYAARNGSQQTSFPWGNDWNADAANVGTKKISEVGTTKDQTTSGVKDMLGNVIEWTSSEYSVYPGYQGKAPSFPEERFVIRASSFGEDRLKTPQWLLTRRQALPETFTSEYLGFRLACQP
jgi:formylglycine-generating enzyme required for sulfatase activity